MSLTNHSRARTFSLFAALVAGIAPGVTQAGSSGPALWFQGTRIEFADSRPAVGDIGVPSNDPGLLTFLNRLSARVSYQPGQRYVVITTADRREISFTVGENDFSVDGVRQSGPFPVAAQGNAALLPFYTVARALDVAAITEKHRTILQPQITTLDAHEDHGRTVVMVHGATALHPQFVSAPPGQLRLRFAGVGTSLEPSRTVLTPGVRMIGATQSGPAEDPVTTLMFSTAGVVHQSLLPAYDPHGVVVAVAPAGVALGGAQSQQPVALASPVATSAPVAALPVAPASPAPTWQPTPSIQNPQSVVVSQVMTESRSGAFVVRVAVSGMPKYRWRILGDGRFFVDIPGASLAIPAREQTLRDDRVSSLRVKENGTPVALNVRLALSLSGPQNVHVSSDASNLVIRVDGAPQTVAERGGSGQVGGSQRPGTLNTGESVPVPGYPGLGTAQFTPPPVLPGTRTRVIVLDPGHGGSDSGALGNGLTEKNITLDIARRLRTILTARGWQVVMTRDSDVDVFAPNDSAREELQARCDVANRINARLFVSIHVNSFTSPDLRGTTTYYYKPGDERFAQIVEQRLIGLLGTQDDGARKENFYVVRHTTMPSILVETAFLSNSADADRLRRPDFRQNVAEAIGDGITAYSGAAPAGGGAGTRGGVTAPNSLGDPPADDLAP